jgi:hypothetical protein
MGMFLMFFVLLLYLAAPLRYDREPAVKKKKETASSGIVEWVCVVGSREKKVT